MRWLLVIGALTATSGVSAQPSATKPAPVRQKAISVGTWSLSGLGGVQAQYEMPLGWRPGWSLIAGGGFRFSARKDYSSSTLSAGGEARYWLKRRAVWTDVARGSAVGWFVGGRLDLAWTRTRDDLDDRTIGNNLATALTGTFGYRFLIRRRVELTPMIGLGLTRETDLGGRLPGWTRGTVRFGMTIGWMF